MSSIGTRRITLLAALAAIAVGGGFLFGASAEVAGATAIAFAAAVSLITVRDLASQAHSRARARRPVAASPSLEQLKQIDRSLAGALATEIGVDHELRPLLRPIAAIRLARRGVDLDNNEVEARAILGEELWELVRGKGPHSSRYPDGISIADLRSMIERLERT